jgi:hypothetical protein
MRSLAVAALLMTACSTYAYSTFSRGARTPRSILEQRRALSEPIRSEQLSSQPAVRHRRSAVSWSDIVVTASKSAMFSSAPVQQVASVVPAAVPADAEKLVVEAWIEMQADDVAKTTAVITAQVVADGGRVVSSNVIGTDRAASSAALELRVPPAKTVGFLSWLGAQGEIESRRTLASDVGKLLLDQELELKNLEITMGRLQALAAKDVPIKELLEIEREMTRVRGEIERVKGEQRWLVDRVELATVTVTLTRDGGALDPVPDARLHAGPRLAMLVLFDPEGRPRTRVGGGGMVRVHRHLTFDLDVFPRQDGDTRAVIATIGSALYSGNLGFGRRRFLNPYLGARLGYGYLSGEGSPVAAVELGLELYRHRLVLVEIAARATVFLPSSDRAEAALHALAGATVPF